MTWLVKNTPFGRPPTHYGKCLVLGKPSAAVARCPHAERAFTGTLEPSQGGGQRGWLRGNSHVLGPRVGGNAARAHEDHRQPNNRHASNSACRHTRCLRHVISLRFHEKVCLCCAPANWSVACHERRTTLALYVLRGSTDSRITGNSPKFKVISVCRQPPAEECMGNLLSAPGRPDRGHKRNLPICVGHIDMMHEDWSDESTAIIRMMAQYGVEPTSLLLSHKLPRSDTRRQVRSGVGYHHSSPTLGGPRPRCGRPATPRWFARSRWASGWWR